MEKIHLIMPMGGGGTRFGNKGFNVPKPLIDLKGKPFFYWATQSVLKFVEVQDITFVVLKDHIERFEIDKRIKEIYPDALITVIPEVLNGAVLTCMEGVRNINDDLPILFVDCDLAFRCSKFYDFCSIGDFSSIDGALMTFESDSPSYSYAQIDESGFVTKTVEKVVVSNEAICGAYLFGSREVFEKGVSEYLEECAYKEFFISGVYNILVRMGKKIITFKTDSHLSFGTPDEYDLACKNNELDD